MLLPPLLSTEVTPPADSQSHLHTINNAKNNLFKNEPTAIDISISIFTVLNLTWSSQQTPSYEQGAWGLETWNNLSLVSQLSK